MTSESDAFEAPPRSTTAGASEGDESAELSYDGADDAPSEVAAAMAAHEADLLAIDGVMGVGIGTDAIGGDAITVYVGNIGDADRLPSELGGFPVEVVVTGEIDAY